ncbi:membrane protein insertase YidC [Hyphobacterium marinum]|uniref:Membrane protein insertase YidC n=1 Tax=Hyphobacterium marinum TaxID=3116574 RepID=A0ABU7LW94_9PROT|nr:membrane protein insertase YidC [Hyphobacterium sp. Y6023]MEE2565834.1 membrane protein insertase YidC [Hyphobacterium sp. Y6023]
MGDNKNMIIAIAIAIGVMFIYQFLVLEPAARRQRAELEAQQAEIAATGGVDTTVSEVAVDRDTALASETRIEIDAPSVAGSFSLTGTRFDDLRLLRHRTTIEDDSPVVLLNPRGSEHAYFADDGWAAGANGPRDVPGATTTWTLAEGNRLTPDTPVVLEYAGSDGLTFRRRIEIDENYMFTVTDTVTNTGSAAATLSRYGRVRQLGEPPDLSNFFILHEGPIAMVGGSLTDRKYDNVDADDPVERDGVGGWVGITGKYWMTAVIPDQSVEFEATIQRIERQGDDVFQTSYQTQPLELAPGETTTSQSRVFAGAKRADVLQAYEEDLGIQRFDMAIDWGMFWFLTRPYFWLLHTLAGVFGGAYGFGFAILAVTVLVKLLFFPIANRAYVSMAKMKNLQPKMTEIRERHADDKQKQQQEIIALYQREKVNPLAGCLPILLQIPVFYALYKTIFVTLELRHQPFPGWIQDLSAPDPTNMWNLFGALPFDPSGWPVLGGFLAIGAWPLIMGVTMWAQQALNPPPPDKMQARIFAFMPIMFTIILAPFAAGLVIYWAWNNFLSVLQQYIIMRRQGVETQFDKLVKRLTGGAKESES